MDCVMRLALLAFAAILLFSVFGCTGQESPPAQEQTQPSQTAQNQLPPAQAAPANEIPPATNADAGIGAAGAAETGGTGSAGTGEGGAAAEQPGLNFKEWKAPDGSITLQLPQGWQASERQVDNCTVSWAALDPAGTSSAYMDNEVMVFKSEDAKQMYKAYGMAGIDGAPVAGYLGAEQAVQQIIAPLTGASRVQVTYNDNVASQQFSQAVCANGLAACDAQVFEAAYQRNGILMRGEYLVHTYDFGDGTTWWINIWGYTSPAAEWVNSSGALEEIFTSAKYTDAWAARCSPGAADASSVISGVVERRQAASDSAAEAWDKYISGQ